MMHLRMQSKQSSMSAAIRGQTDPMLRVFLIQQTCMFQDPITALGELLSTGVRQAPQKMPALFDFI